MGVNPLVGPNDSTLGPRFPDMVEAYSREYRELRGKPARNSGSTLQEGVYAAMLGPSYEPQPRSVSCALSARTWWACPQMPEVIAAITWG